MSIAQLGLKRSEEGRKNMSVSAKLRNVKPQFIYDKSKKVEHVESGKIYNSAKEASLSIGMNKEYVCTRIRRGKDDWRYL